MRVVRWTDGELQASEAEVSADARILAVEWVGLCPTETALAPDWPLGLGHELVVRHRGELCAMAPFCCCGQCVECRNGRYAQCLAVNSPSLGWGGHGGLGGQVELRDERFLVPLPRARSPHLFTLTEPMAAGVMAARRVTGGSSLVIGCGPVGIGAALTTRAEGGEVTAVGRHRWQAELLSAHGVTISAAPDTAFEHVLVCAGTLEALELAGRAVAPDGVVHLVAMNVENPTWRAAVAGSYASFRKGVGVRHSYMYDLQALHDAVDLVAGLGPELEVAVVHVQSEDDLMEAYVTRHAGRRPIFAPRSS